MPALIGRPRDDEELLTAKPGRSLSRWSVLASAGLHGAALLLLLMALFGPWKPAEEPVVRVTLLSDGPGAAGASGGAKGGGGQDAMTSPPPAPEKRVVAAPTPEEPAAPTTATAETPPPETAPPPLQAVPLPAPPRHKPLREPHLAKAPPPAPREPPRVAEAPAPTPVAAAPGTGKDLAGGTGVGIGAEGQGHGAIGGGPREGPGDDYLDRLRGWLNRYKHYPPSAAQQKQEGGLLVSFVILRDGTVLDARIERSSGFPLLDEAALKMLHDASPVPPLPDRYRAERLAVDLPVQFSIGFFERLF